MIAKLFRHPVPQIIGAVLRAESADKTANSIKSQLASAKLPAVKELADFDFVASPVNEPLIHDLAGGGFLEAERRIVPVDGTGTGKTHFAVAFARSCIRRGARGRFYNVVDLPCVGERHGQTARCARFVPGTVQELGDRRKRRDAFGAILDSAGRLRVLL